ncbi:MAG: glucose-6-phosphate isomerase, partial [Bacteroidales bacterium]|nr:glucose-6-phosphate isomerase [Bacteroidales bacterium]
MVKIDLSGCDAFVTKARFDEYVDKALAAQQVLEDETGAGNDFLGWQHLPSAIGQEQLDDCLGVVDRWLEKEVDLVVVIGIGGSYLGAKAAIEALNHSFSSLLNSQGPRVVFAGENLSEDYTAELLDLLQTRNAACVVISKSGTTTEPAVAFRLVKQHLEETYGKEEACNRIVAITDKARGALKSLSNQEGYKTFVIEDNIGGRFSVLTPVGL